MLRSLAYLLGKFNLSNLCYLYFFFSPVFLDREDRFAATLVFAGGYFLSGSISVLAFSEALTRFVHVIRLNWISLLLISLVSLCFLTVLINTPERLSYPNLIYYKYAKLILPVISFFVMVNIWGPSNLPRLYTLLIAMAWLSVMWLIPETIISLADNHPTRFGSYFFDPNKYALFLNVLYGMLFPKFVRRIFTGEPIGRSWVPLFAIYAILFLTQSRSGMFTCVVLTLVALWTTGSRGIWKRILPFLLPLLILLPLAIMLRYTQHESNAVASDMGRFWTYMVAFKIISDVPLTGIGFANILSAYSKYGGIYLYLLGRPLAIHNATLEHFAEEGVFGAIFYLLVVFVPIGMLVTRIRKVRLTRYPIVETAALAIPISFFCFGLFYHNYLADDHFWAYMAFTVIVIRARTTEGVDLKVSWELLGLGSPRADRRDAEQPEPGRPGAGG